jgi:hypothetical protein
MAQDSMAQAETGGAETPQVIQSSAAFPPVYYDSPVTMMVLDATVAGYVKSPVATITACWRAVLYG